MSVMPREHRALLGLEGPWSGGLQDVALSDRLRDLFAGSGLLDWAFDGGTRLIRIEEFTDGDTSVIRAELPGIDPDKDVEITVDDGVLRIRASREERAEEDRADGYRSEFHYGTLVRSFRLPEDVSADDVHATYQDGILEVRVPTPPPPASAAPQKIAVDRG
ncbi:Hsp20/alpha crystallin family protein [Nocardioides humi]|uniref:Hsp20/alpha crystallin family protein n=1 Tax=Nocardioides humi TaxID=449461 RepID=A0ABN2BJN9_9ACTN|nr:Hsp20/alpha crystallin family protein [Nocardioides humi]